MHNNKMIQGIWTSSNQAMHASKEMITTGKSACVCVIIILCYYSSVINSNGLDCVCLDDMMTNLSFNESLIDVFSLALYYFCFVLSP